MRHFFVLVFFAITFSRAQFPDVPEGHWAESAVFRMTELGVVTGFLMGNFGVTIL